MFKRILKVEALDDYCLKLDFDNSEAGIFDLKPYLDKGIFRELKDKSFFKTVKVSFDTVDWDNRIDIDPEFLYSESKMKS